MFPDCCSWDRPGSALALLLRCEPRQAAATIGISVVLCSPSPRPSVMSVTTLSYIGPALAGVGVTLCYVGLTDRCKECSRASTLLNKAVYGVIEASKGCVQACVCISTLPSWSWVRRDAGQSSFGFNGTCGWCMHRTSNYSVRSWQNCLLNFRLHAVRTLWHPAESTGLITDLQELAFFTFRIWPGTRCRQPASS